MMFTDSESGVQTGHSGGGLCLLSGIWDFSCEDLNHWGLESSGSFFIPMSGP